MNNKTRITKRCWNSDDFLVETGTEVNTPACSGTHPKINNIFDEGHDLCPSAANCSVFTRCNLKTLCQLDSGAYLMFTPVPVSTRDEFVKLPTTDTSP